MGSWASQRHDPSVGVRRRYLPNEDEGEEKRVAPPHIASPRRLGYQWQAMAALPVIASGRDVTALPAKDIRLAMPRFQQEHFGRNLRLLDGLAEVAREQRASMAQVVLAWLLGQGDDIVPIPGTKRRRYLEENLGAAAIHLTRDELSRIDEVSPKGVASGERYPAMMMQFVNG